MAMLRLSAQPDRIALQAGLLCASKISLDDGIMDHICGFARTPQDHGDWSRLARTWHDIPMPQFFCTGSDKKATKATTEKAACYRLTGTAGIDFRTKLLEFPVE